MCNFFFIRNKIGSLLFLLLIMVATSCSTTTGYRSGKYASSHKRVVKSKKSSKTYVKKVSEPKFSSNSTVIASVSGIRHEIIDYAIRFRGVKYKYGGKSPDTGFDCSGFTGYIFSQNGIPLSGPSDIQAKRGVNKTMKQLLPGDLVFFGDENRISHVAIVAETSDNHIQVVHATTSAGVKMDEITSSEYWSSRFLFGKDIISSR